MNIIGKRVQQSSRRMVQKSTQGISALVLLRPSYILNKLKQNLAGRKGIFRLLVLGSSIHMIATFGGSLMPSRELSMSVSEYLQNISVQESDVFQVYGVLKGGSVHLKRGTNQLKFTMSDHKGSIDLFYEGMNRFEFKEGETILATAYCPDIQNRTNVVCVDYQTKHAMELNDWREQSNISKKSYGVN